MANNNISRMSEGSGRTKPKSNLSGSMKPTGGKFVANMGRLAKLRSESRSKAPLQVGNVLTKKAPMKGAGSFGSKIDKPEGTQFAPIQATEGQTALDQKQPGASNKNMQRGKGKGSGF
jgi:hypothetical protein